MADTVGRAERARIMAAVKARDTTPELIVRQLVRSLGLRFTTDAGRLPGRPDLAFSRRRKAIFVHGCFWHMHDCGRCRMPATRRGYWSAKLDGNRRRDRRTVAALRRAGWSVAVVWECQTRSAGRRRLAARLARFLT